MKERNRNSELKSNLEHKQHEVAGLRKEGDSIAEQRLNNFSNLAAY